MKTKPEANDVGYLMDVAGSSPVSQRGNPMTVFSQ